MFMLLQRNVLATTCLVLTACAAVTVTTDYDHSASFAKYRTYALAPVDNKVPLSPSSELALRNSLRTNLAMRGVTEMAGNADLQVVPRVSTQEKVTVFQGNNFGYAGPYGYQRYGMWAGAPGSYTDVSQYTEGSLILDFVDTKTQKLVFRGVGTGIVSDPQTNAERITEAVTKIVHDLPSTTQP